ncbi:Oidioi.mRNA.OKI2018_I69.XSR.g16528.t2.cds [Oikopleura dioica]|uniref:Oidioi.mRNA.OKI2018_I69.XSR.g16528.t2.cds n=1 Tax=Oikopleura dioica TaxID=34765 RepID=A0ABN7SKE4_OIKDI|nr:Oidioi.mRNA.OKI2018_I69.XSR.g16528.t2.cds [Oikopleura dioica]
MSFGARFLDAKHNGIFERNNRIPTEIYKCYHYVSLAQKGCQLPGLCDEAQCDLCAACPTIFELSHCWTETPHGQRLETDCPTDSLLQTQNETTYRDCSPQGYFQNGTADPERPAGWHSIRETHIQYLQQNCSLYAPDYTADYSSSYNQSASNSTSYEDDFYYDYSSGPILNSEEPYDLGTLTVLLKMLMIFSILSFITTIVSLLLMSFFLRKCTRVYIHMNLLFTFMLRSLFFIWSQVTFMWRTPRMEEQYSYLPDLINDLENYEFSKLEQKDLAQMEAHYEQYCVAHIRNEKKFTFLCQIYPVLINYSIIACFAWLVCEGLYLVLLQKQPTILFKNFNPMHWFIALSWGFPGCVVGLWVYKMYTRENGSFQCFSVDEKYDKILNYPINFFVFTGLIIFFILIIEIIKKLRAPEHIAGSGNFTIRMSKATLSMIPLLGAQYSIVPYLTVENGVPRDIANVCTTLSVLFSSTHGIIVSFLYCFTSTEMKNAIMRRWKVHKEIQSVYKEISSRRQSRDTFTTHLKVSRDDDMFSASLTQRQHSAPSSQIFGEKGEFDSESPRSSDSAKVWEKEQGEAGSVAGSRTNCSDFSDSGFSDEKNIQSCDLLDDY